MVGIFLFARPLRRCNAALGSLGDVAVDDGIIVDVASYIAARDSLFCSHHQSGCYRFILVGIALLSCGYFGGYWDIADDFVLAFGARTNSL